MNITEIRIHFVKKEQSKVKAFASVVFDEEFVVHDFKVVETERGIFVGMPSRKVGESEYREIAHPITSRAREQLQATILRAYQDEMAKPENATVPGAPSL